MKQAIIIRSDLKLSKGKIASQAAHASLEAYKASSFDDKNIWDEEGQKKIVLKVNSESEMLGLFKKCKTIKIPAVLIHDAGKTQVAPGTLTALGIGPAEDILIDKIIDKLKLL